MRVFDDYIFKYGLHDCKFRKFVIEEKYIKFYFDKGVYCLDNFGREQHLTEGCVMKVELEKINDEFGAERFIQILQIFKRRLKEINSHKFLKLMDNNEFVIVTNFYTFFNNTILIKGFLQNKEYEITVCNVKNITFSFVNERH